MEKTLQLLKETAGTNDKCAILASIKNTDILNCFKLAYDPFKMFYINKIEPTSIGKKTFAQTVNDFYTLTDKLNKRIITGNEARDAVNSFLNECTSETQDVYIKILKKDLKVGVTDTLMNKVYGDDFIEVFKVQLANKYLESKNSKSVKNLPFFWASRKMNGLRNYYKNGHFFTRNGHEILGFDHIIAELNQLPDEFLDGELFSEELQFSTIQGAVMSNKNIDPVRKSTIFYNVFVVGNKSYKNTEDMINRMNEIDWSKFKYVRKVEYVKVSNNEESITALCEKFTKEGYEGVMLRHPEIWYEWKRSNALMKLKLFREEDFTIIGVFEGTKGSKYENMLGGVIVEGPVSIKEGDKEMAFIKSECGSGFFDIDRIEYWKNTQYLIGKKCEIKFQSLTDDNSSLNFPIWMGLKLDRQ